MDPEYKEHHKYTLYRYYYVKSLAALVSGDDRLEEYLRLFDEYAGDPRDEGNESLAEFFELLATALNEIYKRNVETVRDTLEGLLDRYATKVGTNPRISDRVYIPAAALLVLARRRGLAIEIDHEHLPQHIVELLE